MTPKPVLALQANPHLPNRRHVLGHGKRADTLWTRYDFRAICQRMLNGNSDYPFMQAYYDERTAKARFPKSKTKKASKRLEWAFDTICGKAESKTGIGFYPDNDDGESCWGALDFDAHNDHEETSRRAYELAGKAFSLLCHEAPDLWVIAGTSGQSGGWHVFVFSPYFHATRQWTLFLREVALHIGAPIQSGICEIFPDDNEGQKKGIRAPGTWNPKDDSFGLIAHDGVTEGLKAFPSDKEGNMSLSVLCKATKGERLTLHSREILTLYRGEDNRWKNDFAITSVRTRRMRLETLVGQPFIKLTSLAPVKTLDCNMQKQSLLPHHRSMNISRTSKSYGHEWNECGLHR